MKYVSVGVLTTTEIEVVKASANEQIITRNLHFNCFAASGAGKVSLWHVPEGESVGDAYSIISNFTIRNGAYLSESFYIALQPGDSLWAKSDTLSQHSLTVYYYSTIASLTPVERAIIAGTLPRYPA